MWILDKITKEQFVAAITADKRDSFAKTFVAKANMQQMWDKCVGVVENGELLGAIIVTISKRQPHCANLQLLHTFCNHRRKGVGKRLVNYAMQYALENGSEYFRVSSEPDAVAFYESCGFVFFGKQKSGTSLSICKLTSDDFVMCDYDMNDAYIRSRLFTNAKGGLVNV